MQRYLLLEIEKYRNKMIHLSDSYGLTSEVVVETSKRLDGLLNALQDVQGRRIIK